MRFSSLWQVEKERKEKGEIEYRKTNERFRAKTEGWRSKNWDPGRWPSSKGRREKERGEQARERGMVTDTDGEKGNRDIKWKRELRYVHG